MIPFRLLTGAALVVICSYSVGQADEWPVDESQSFGVSRSWLSRPASYETSVCAPAVCNPAAGRAGDEGTYVAAAPYLWATAMEGTVTVLGRPQEIDLSLSDLVDLLKEDLRGAAMFHVEAGRDRTGFLVDAMIVSVNPREPLRNAEASLELEQVFLELLGTHRVISEAVDWAPGKKASVELLAGGRYYLLKNALTIDPFNPILPTISTEQTERWVDLVVGVRGRLPISETLDVFGRTDVGGFGIGTSSDSTWNFTAGAEYACTESCSLLAGYRVFDVDEFKGEGGTAFGFDVTLHGPFAAFAWRF